MPNEIKNLLDELIDFEKSRKPGQYLVKTYDLLGEVTLYSTIGWLLLWHKEVFRYG